MMVGVRGWLGGERHFRVGCEGGQVVLFQSRSWQGDAVSEADGAVERSSFEWTTRSLEPGV